MLDIVQDQSKVVKLIREMLTSSDKWSNFSMDDVIVGEAPFS